MKSLIFILVICTIISCGTDQNPSKSYNYSIVNNSSYVIEIVPYNIQGVKEIQKKITIPIGGVLNRFFNDTSPPQGFNFQSMIVTTNGIGYLTSVDFIFNNLKKTNYNTCISIECASPPRNIFNLNYNFGQNQVYIITNSDYDAATDCGGNCN